MRDINKKRKRSINNNLNSLFGIPQSSFQIPLRLFKELDPQRLLVTIGEQLNKVYIEGDTHGENLNEGFDEPQNSWIKAIITSASL